MIRLDLIHPDSRKLHPMSSTAGESQKAHQNSKGFHAAIRQPVEEALFDFEVKRGLRINSGGGVAKKTLIKPHAYSCVGWVPESAALSLLQYASRLLTSERCLLVECQT